MIEWKRFTSPLNIFLSNQMADYQTILLKLNSSLNMLREREAKYAGNAPVDLLNQIADHEQAVALTQQALTGALAETGWYEALQTLNVDSRTRSRPAISACDARSRTGCEAC